ncbi:MAG: HAD-IIIC family phosphatase [Candidatus Acidiferrum sp.]
MKTQTQSQSTESAESIGVEPELFARHNGACYRTPTDLQVSPAPDARFLVIGGCLAEPFSLLAPTIDSHFHGDFLLMNNFDSFPQIPVSQASQYDFQIVHIPLRSILGTAYFHLPDDGSEHEHFLQMTQDCLARYLSNVLRLNVDCKLLTFVLGFFVPQQNPLGRFQPRFDLRNVMHFVERLNMFLAAEISKYHNVYFVDIDQISSGIGKKYCQDDMVWSFTHGTTLSDGDFEHDLRRIQPTPSMRHYYSPQWFEFFEALLYEIVAMWRTTRQMDAVKLVAVDLDDTLWRGIAAEGTLGILEGWPMGFMESLVLLKKRGILLAIVSRNDEHFIQSNWNQIVQGQISLDDFVIRKINFGSKAQNLAEIIAAVNLLPRNVVMIDDNPAERAAIREQLPDVRVLGSHPYYLKRILLWAPETQRSVTSQESACKADLVRAQLQREDVRKTMSHEQFLQTLELAVSISIIRNANDVFLHRALELLNKTNQFNMTGARYTFEQCHQLLATGRQLHILHAEDRFTQYGLIGTAWVSHNCVEQFVVSCRALGLGVEDAFLANLSRELAVAKWTVVLGKLVPTDTNMACREVYRRNGFTQLGGDAALWPCSLLAPFEAPRHVAITTTFAQKLPAPLATARTANK